MARVRSFTRRKPTGGSTRVASFSRKGRPKRVKDRVSPVRKKRSTSRRAKRASVAKRFVKGKRKAKPSKTSSHAKAGLHRIGTKGNRYTDTSGRVFHRTGRGKKSRFVKGEPPKKKRRKKSSRKSTRPASRRRRGGKTSRRRNTARRTRAKSTRKSR